MRRRTPRNLLLPIIILIAGMIVSRLERPIPTTKPSAPPQSTFSGRVVGVSDGDTIKVLYQNREIKVRLFGVDCPEKNQAYGTAAKQFTSKMVFGKDIAVEAHDRDRYGRVVGWVKAQDGRVINLELVRAGYAWWYKNYAPDDEQLGDLESQARAAHRGLWADKNPVSPWEFRKEHR